MRSNSKPGALRQTLAKASAKRRIDGIGTYPIGCVFTKVIGASKQGVASLTRNVLFLLVAVCLASTFPTLAQSQTRSGKTPGVEFTAAVPAAPKQMQMAIIP